MQREITEGESVKVVYYAGHYENRPSVRTVVKVFKNWLRLSDGYKYDKETGKCIGHYYAIIEEEK